MDGIFFIYTLLSLVEINLLTKEHEENKANY